MKRLARILFTIIIFFCTVAAAFAQSIPFPGPGGVAAGSVSILHTDTQTSTSGASSYNFTASLGTNPTSGRDIIVGVCDSATGAPSVSSVTINSVSASQTATAASSFNRVSFWIANVASGTTGVTISVGLGAAALRAAISVYATQNQHSTTATATQNTTTNDTAMTLSSISAAGIAVAMGCDNADVTNSWTGLSKDTDTQYGVTTISTASSAFGTAETNYNVTDNQSSATSPVFLTASFR
jgi:hypothetical protein